MNTPLIKIAIEDVTRGMLLGYMGGMVRVDSVEAGTDETVVYVSIGKLKNHPTRWRPGTIVSPLVVAPDVRPWYGV